MYPQTLGHWSVKWVGQRSVFTFCRRSLKIGNGQTERPGYQGRRKGESGGAHGRTWSWGRWAESRPRWVDAEPSGSRRGRALSPPLKVKVGAERAQDPLGSGCGGRGCRARVGDSGNKSRKAVPLDCLQEVDLVQTISMRDSLLPPTLPFFLALCSKYCCSPWLRTYNASPFQTFQGMVFKLRSSWVPRKRFSV